jgi:hypothetical protein
MATAAKFVQPILIFVGLSRSTRCQASTLTYFSTCPFGQLISMVWEPYYDPLCRNIHRSMWQLLGGGGLNKFKMVTVDQGTKWPSNTKILRFGRNLVMKLSGSVPDFFLSKITRPRWLELPIARTDFDSPFEFEPAKFYCTIFKRGGNSTDNKKCPPIPIPLCYLHDLLVVNIS